MPDMAKTRLTIGRVTNAEHPVHHAAVTLACLAANLSDGELNLPVFPPANWAMPTKGW